MTTDSKIRDEKLQYDINRKAANIIIIINMNESRAGEKILPSDQSRMIEQAKFTYSPLVKALEK